MLVNDECSSWYNRVSSFLIAVWNRRKENLPGTGSVCMTQQSNLTPECVVNGTECYDDAVHAKTNFKICLKNNLGGKGYSLLLG